LVEKVTILPAEIWIRGIPYQCIILASCSTRLGGEEDIVWVMRKTRKEIEIVMSLTSDMEVEV
jgi:hypothetical protein